MREKIKDLVFHYRGNYRQVALALQSNLDCPSYICETNYVTYLDESYPQCFKQLKYPPFCLFYEGDLSLLNKSCLSIVGSRNPGSYGLKMTQKIVTLLKQEYVCISGFAVGIDGCVHRYANETIAYLGCGLDIDYPKPHRELRDKISCLISEYPPKVMPLKHHFPWRNRLIACSSQALFVMSAELNSGTMHTVNEALTLNKEIYCLPYRLNDVGGQGCLQLIQEGALIINEDVLMQFKRGLKI